MFRLGFSCFLVFSLYAQRVITTVAGTNSFFSANGKPATQVPLGNLSGLALDLEGNVLVADTDNDIVVRINKQGILNVVAGNGIIGHSGDNGMATSASLVKPIALALDALGNLYISDSISSSRSVRIPSFVRKVTPDGIITTFAGGGQNDPTEGGPATQVELLTLGGIAVDRNSNVLLVDVSDSRILRIDTNGTITTIAGTGQTGFSGDGGPATAATLNLSSGGIGSAGLSVDGRGNILITDRGNRRVRKITPDGVITTVAGGGKLLPGDNVPANQLFLFDPEAAIADDAGNIYIFDRLFSVVLKVSSDGLTHLLTKAFGLLGPFGGDGGPATDASVIASSDACNGLVLDAAGNLYVADAGNGRIRKIGGNGIITTIGGNGFYRFGGDGGPATSALLNAPTGITIGPASEVIFMDEGNGRIRAIGPEGAVRTIAGNGNYITDDYLNQEAMTIGLYGADAVIADGTGNIYIGVGSGVIRAGQDGKVLDIVNQSGKEGFSGDGGPALAAELGIINGLALDSGRNLYVADSLNHRVRRVTAGGIITTVAGSGPIGGKGSFSGDEGPATQATLNLPTGIAVDGAGTLYIVDSGNERIRKVTPDGIIHTIGGNGIPGFSGDGGPALQASLSVAYSPSSGIVVGGEGTVYFSDTYNNRVRQITLDGTISTFAGTEYGFSGDGGRPDQASLSFPLGLAIDPAGNVYIADFGNNRVRVVLTAPPLFSDVPASLRISGFSGGPPIAAQLFTLATSVPGMMFTANVTTTSGGDWLMLSDNSGASPRLIQVTANPFKLLPGTYQGTITISVPYANPSVRRLSVNFTVEEAIAQKLGVDRDHLSFTYAKTSMARNQTLTVSNNGGGPLPFTTAVALDSGQAANWLKVAPQTGTATPATPVALTVQADPSSLPPGTYTGRIAITGTVSGSGSVSVPVTMTITTNPQILLLSQTGLTFTAVQNGGVIPAQTFAVLNLGSGLLNWTVQTSTLSGGNWLIATPKSGSSNAASTSSSPLVTVSIDAAGLKPDVYYGLVKVISTGAANTPQEVVVVLEVLRAGTDAAPIVQPNGLIFTGLAGKSSPSSQDVLVYDPTGTNKSFRSGRTTVDGVNWIATLPSDATIAPDQPTRIVVQPLVENLASGTYRGTLTLQFSDGRVSTIAITFVVTGTGSAGTSVTRPGSDGAQQNTADVCTPKQLLPALISLGTGFTVPAGYPQGLEAQVVDDCGNMHQAGKVVVEFSNGDPPVKLSSLNNGRWDGTWKTGTQQLSQVTLTVTAENPTLQIKGQNQITGGLGSLRAAPVVADNGVVSAASLAPQVPLAPGGLISIFGQRLSEGTSQAPPVSTELASTTVTIGDQQLPLLYASDGQVNGVVPFGVNVNVNQQLLVQRGATYAQPIYVDIAGTQPAIFQSGQQGIIVDSANNLIGPANPAHAGDVVVIYCSGLGLVSPAVADGAVTPGTPLSSTVDPVSVTIGGQNAPVQFAGLTPGLVGLYQVNATVPQGVMTGDLVPVSIMENERSSPVVSTSVR